ncbi:hypothetical protein OK348_05620 [Flavobacterium sp. MXW15]|uniref:Uncharacterized protein n=1 Tax=Xanthomonas chitinilytica TaxID=2989819 RepID=A0ABT3JSP5_9XANT|nr:hypothetical protein [Xanthomonas sp. H13-6]MCW4454268.1 hypothetical protein [Flavobacterium sp. MXW15]MCW4471501.1 hypothetical protein [Xanthomonas sp. H13-6]
MPLFVEERFFPALLADDVRIVAPVLSRSQMHPPAGGCRVRVGEDSVDPPYRVYYARGDLMAAASRGGNPGLIATCLGTRHHDGFLREECVRKLLRAEEPWIAPYVIQLLGEYVLETGQAIERALPARDLRMHVGYARSNRPHLETLERRAVSYWNAYYRQDFPACRVLANLLDAARGGADDMLPVPAPFAVAGAT